MTVDWSVDQTLYVPPIKVEWVNPSFKESMAEKVHWMDKVFVNGVLRFKVFCGNSEHPMGNCKAFVEDVKENKFIEFNGARGESGRIVSRILKIKEDEN